MKYKNAIVTGASRGLGRAIARSLAKRGLNLTLASRSETALALLAEELSVETEVRVETHVCDLRRHEDNRSLIEAALSHYGRIDVLINNAGIGWYKPFMEWTEQEIVDSIDLNLTSPILCTRAVLPSMFEAGRGLIINIGSDLCRRFLPNMAPYVASKFGLLGFSGSVLREVKDRGVKICTVMPGMIDTNFNESQEGSREETWAMKPSVLAEQIASLLDLPEHLIVDEITIHPMQQDF